MSGRLPAGGVVRTISAHSGSDFEPRTRYGPPPCANLPLQPSQMRAYFHEHRRLPGLVLGRIAWLRGGRVRLEAVQTYQRAEMLLP